LGSTVVAVIVHLVAFRFRHGLDTATRDAVLDGLRALPEHYPAMRDFRLGANESTRDGRFEYAFTVHFDTWPELDAYLGSDRHESFVARWFRPNVAERAIVSFRA
jgi:2,3-dihydroxy-p-cumate/2,3-dihydroxybenzoate 3,4-dioxygenase